MRSLKNVTLQSRLCVTKRGFSLVELLIVLGIICVLIGLSCGVAHAVRRYAIKQQAAAAGRVQVEAQRFGEVN